MRDTHTERKQAAHAPSARRHIRRFSARSLHRLLPSIWDGQAERTHRVYVSRGGAGGGDGPEPSRREIREGQLIWS